MRIISGTCRGRRLKTPKGMDTRPTQDRVRETIFNVLQHHTMAGRNVLDLFAGTGAMGLEALSRGSASLLSVDNRTKKLLEANRELCRFEEEMTIIPLPLERVKSVLSESTFDLVFADPPYLKGYVEKVCRLLDESQCIEEKGIIVIESHKDESFAAPTSWVLWKEQVFGYTKILYFIKNSV